MAFKVVTCEVLTFIAIIFGADAAQRSAAFRRQHHYELLFATKVENCTLWLSFPDDKSTSHFSHIGLSKLLSVGFCPHLLTVYPFFLALCPWEGSSGRFFCSDRQFNSFPTADLCLFLIISFTWVAPFQNLYVSVCSDGRTSDRKITSQGRTHLSVLIRWLLYTVLGCCFSFERTRGEEDQFYPRLHLLC